MLDARMLDGQWHVASPTSSSQSFTFLTWLRFCSAGKWHLGQNELAALPTGRGFDTYYGYWSGAETYYTHEARGYYDFADGLQTCRGANGSYSTSLFAERAVSIIQGHDFASRPLFLYLAFQAVHWPLEAPESVKRRFDNSTGGSERRRSVAAMAALLDEGVGNVSRSLKQAGQWDKTLVIFVSDNGGPTHGFEGTNSNNYPMRGGKNTLWEGGTRVVAAVRGAGIDASLIGTVSLTPIHATDWMPTLLRYASGRKDWQALVRDLSMRWRRREQKARATLAKRGLAVETDFLYADSRVYSDNLRMNSGARSGIPDGKTQALAQWPANAAVDGSEHRSNSWTLWTIDSRLALATDNGVVGVQLPWVDDRWEENSAEIEEEPPFLDGDGVDVLDAILTGAVVRKEVLLEAHAPALPWHAYIKNGSLTPEPPLFGFSHHPGHRLETGRDLLPPAMVRGFAGCALPCASDTRCTAFAFVSQEVAPREGIECHWKKGNVKLIDVQQEQVSIRIPSCFFLGCQPTYKCPALTVWQVHGNAIIMGDWKYLHLGPVRGAVEAEWHPPPGQQANTTNYTLRGCNIAEQPSSAAPDECVGAPCLFRIYEDPCEYKNVAASYPWVVERMAKRLAELGRTAVPPSAPDGCAPLVVDGAWRPCDAPGKGHILEQQTYVTPPETYYEPLWES